MSESNDAAAPPEPAAPAAKGGKLLTILALVNFVAVLGLGGYFFYTQTHAAAQPKSAAGDKEHGEKKEGAHGEEAAASEHGKPEEEEEGEHEAEEEAAGEHGKPAEGHGKPAEGHGKAAEGHGDESASDEHSGKGPLLPLESMVTNLAEPDSDRYLKVSMQLRITGEGAKAEVEANLVPVRNQILLYLSSLTIADTSGADNKRDIQKRVKRIANEAMPTSRITQVYFTEFVIQ
jgi:flagellar protein FliL